MYVSESVSKPGRSLPELLMEEITGNMAPQGRLSISLGYGWWNRTWAG